jgi:hypothetical protein
MIDLQKTNLGQSVMKTVLILWLMYSAVTFNTLTAQTIPRVRISGSVVDASTGEPLHDVNVFLANSTRGAASDTKGYFAIENVPLGTYELVVSMIGYEIGVLSIRLTDTKERVFHFKLKSKPIRVPEISISAPSPREWRKNLKKFKKLLLGNSRNASRCKILNPEVLDFQFDEETSEFTASSGQLIEVENRGLGYRIQVYLMDFCFKEDVELRYKSRLKFVPLSPEDEKERMRWEKDRRKAYYGSLRHFLMALSSWQIQEEGFLLYSVSSLGERQRNYLNPDNVLFPGGSPYERRLVFSNYLKVIYTREFEPNEYRMLYEEEPMIAVDGRLRGRARNVKERYQTSWLYNPSESEVIVNTLGQLNNPYALTTYGYWSWERLSDELPWDYLPDSTF